MFLLPTPPSSDTVYSAGLTFSDGDRTRDGGHRHVGVRQCGDEQQGSSGKEEQATALGAVAGGSAQGAVSGPPRRHDPGSATGSCRAGLSWICHLFRSMRRCFLRSCGSTQDVTHDAYSSNPSRPDATTLVAQRHTIIEHLQGSLLPPKARYRLFPNQASPGDRVSRHLRLKYHVDNI